MPEQVARIRVSRDDLGPLLALLLLGIALYSASLYFPLGDHDDLTLLTRVANSASPGYAFLGDWGMGNDRWRPLHIVTLWCEYRLWGVWAGPMQAVNLLLHGANLYLVYRLLRGMGRPPLQAGALAMLGLVSLYVISPTVWVSDRSTLWVVLAALLLLERTAANGWCVRWGWLLGLSLLALSSKESGIILPLLGAALSLAERRGEGTWRAVAALALLVGYMVMRRVLFPAASDSLAPHESGYLLGMAPYDTLDVADGWLPLLAAIENVLKGLVGIALPVFNRNGGVYHPVELLLTAPLWLGTLLLVAFACGLRGNRWQWIALLLVALNAVVHYALFRHRNMYLGQMALVLFVGASPRWDGGIGQQRMRRLMGVALGLVLIAATLWTRQEISFQAWRRAQRLPGLDANNPIVAQAMERYELPSQLVAPGLLGRWPMLDE